MKNSTQRHRILIPALAALFACSVSVLPVAAQGVTSFQLQIPNRSSIGSGFALSKIQVVMTVSVDPTDDAEDVTFEVTDPDTNFDDVTVAKDGMAEGCGPTLDCDLGTSDVFVVEPPDYAGLAAGDPARFIYVLNLQPLTNFDSSDCLDDLSSSEQFTIAITSGQSITGVCLRSFKKPDGGCSAADIVVDSTDPAEVASVLVNSTPTIQACGDSRPALDVVLVLDRSGSMDNSTLGTAPRPKFSALRDAVHDFVDVWDFMEVPDDQIGLVFFDSNEDVAVPLGAFSSSGATVESEIDSECAGTDPPNCSGSTSIGDGLEAAVDEFDFDNDHRRVILLMSNGKENAFTKVTVDDTNNPTEVLVYDSEGGTEESLLDEGEELSIYAVTIGTSTAVKADTNEDLARATDGFYINSEDNAEALRPFFLELLQNFVRFNSWQTLRLATGEVTRSADFEAVVPVTGTTSRLVANLLWDRSIGRLRLTVTPPGGSPIQRSGSGAARLSLELPVTGIVSPEGDWRFEVEVLEMASALKKARFDLVVVGDDHGVDTGFQIASSDYEPGDDIRLEARVSEFGFPIMDLGTNPQDRMVARIIGPGVTIGDLLSESTASPDQPSPDDESTPADAKLHNELQANPQGLVNSDDTITLVDDGGGPDTTAGDGIYTAVRPAPEPGHYNFLFGVEGDSPNAGRFSRQALRTVHVRSVPDANTTDVDTSLQTISGVTNLVVDLTPRTLSGSLMGPGFAAFLWFDPTNGDPVKPVDNLDGTYTANIPFSGNPPDVTVHFVRTSTNLSEDVTVDQLPEPLGGGTVLIDNIPRPSRYRWSLSLHGGANDPRGDLGNACNGGVSYGLDLEYMFSKRFALELFYGREDLDCSLVTNPSIDHLSVNGKVYFLPGTWRVFVLAGVGRYDFDPGSAENGFGLGGGVQANLWSRVALEGTVKYHSVDVAGDSADFLTYHLGARFRF